MELTRDQRVAELARLLYVNVCEPDLERIAKTGSITPTNSLRHASTRRCFCFVRDEIDSGRWFTHQMVTEAIQKLVNDYNLQIPTTCPGFSLGKWISEEATKLLHLLKRSRKSVAGTVNQSAMDTMETQVLDETEERFFLF